jgi:hypothetical protein
MKIEKSVILILLLCVYLALVGYRVTAYNDNVFEIDTWKLKTKSKLNIQPILTDTDPIAPTTKGLRCRIEHVSGKTMNSNGEALTFDTDVPCTECNQYIYKNDNSCISYEYDKEYSERDTNDPIMGTCRPHRRMPGQSCPFKTDTKTFKDVYEALPIELVKSVFT